MFIIIKKWPNAERFVAIKAKDIMFIADSDNLDEYPTKVFLCDGKTVKTASSTKEIVERVNRIL